MLIQVFLLIGFMCLTQGKDCKDISKPHQTRCDMYYKCVVLPSSKNIAWVPTNCKRGLVYESNLKICVVPDANWECNLGEENEPLKVDDNNVYGINNLDYLNKEIQSYRPKYDENGEKMSTDDDDNYDSDTSDDDEERIVVRSDEVDYSGDGSSDDDGVNKNDNIVEKKETYIAIPVNSDPNKSVASHLQRLSQLIQSLKDSQFNKSQSYDLGPNDLNTFLAHHNIKTEYNNQLKNQKKKQDIPMDGRIHPDHLAEILELQQKLQSLNAIQNGDYSTTTTERTFEFGKYPIKSTIQIKSPSPVKNVRITDPGYSSSQIVVNRPEGSVLFSLPNNVLPPNQPQYQSLYNQSPSPPPPQQQQQQQEPYVSQDTLKTVLELSKQLISSSNHQQAIQNYIPEQNYLQPIFRPIYYNIPIHDLPVPIINNYEKKEPKHDDNKDHESNAEPNYVKITSVSGFIDTTPKYQAEGAGADEHSTIIHNHIPITIENPYHQQTNKKSSKVNGPTVAPSAVTITTASGVNHRFDDYNPEFNEGSYATYLTEPHLPNTNPTYSNAVQYSQLNQPNSGTYYVQQGQPYQQQYYQDHQYAVNAFPQTYYTQQTHLNDNNVNHFVNSNTPQYPTLRPAALPSLTTTDPMYSNQNQIHSATPKVESINTYQAIDENDNNSDQQESHNAELPSMIVDNDNYDDDNNVEYDGNDNEDYETNEEDNIAADMNESNVMNLLADLQNHNIPAIQNKQLPERAPINPLLIAGANYDSKRKVVHFGDNFMSIDEYEKLVQPLIDRDAFSGNVDVIPCVTGARQPLAKDCTKYMMCNGATSKVLTYTCPPYTAFNQQSRFCDAKTFGTCKKGALNADTPSALDTINANKRLQLQADKQLEQAQKERDQALKTQQLTALIKQQTQNILNSRPSSSVQRPVRNRRKKIKTTTSAPRPYYRTRPTKKRRKNKPIIRRIPCKEPSKVADSLSIYNYFTCYKGGDGALKARKMTCPAGLIFCERIRLCTSTARCGVGN